MAFRIFRIDQFDIGSGPFNSPHYKARNVLGPTNSSGNVAAQRSKIRGSSSFASLVPLCRTGWQNTELPGGAGERSRTAVQRRTPLLCAFLGKGYNKPSSPNRAHWCLIEKVARYRSAQTKFANAQKQCQQKTGAFSEATTESVQFVKKINVCRNQDPGVPTMFPFNRREFHELHRLG